MAQRPSVLQLEYAFLSAWPAREQEWDGGWLRRYSDGYTKRANCVQSMDPSDGENALDRIEAYKRWTAARGPLPTFRVTPLASEQVVRALNQMKWHPFEQSCVMAMPVGAAFTPKHDFRLFAAADPEWFEIQARMSGYGPDTIAKLKAVLERIESPATGIVVYGEDGEPAAAALTNNNEGIGVYLNVVVREKMRGHGYGRSAMQVALNWSRDRDAHWAAIQVLADNVPAVNLYRSLGFEEVYRYHYRREE